MLEKLEELARAGIRVLPIPGIDSHFLLERDGFGLLVERAGDGLGQAGSAGLITESGLAVLVWEQGQAFFVAKGMKRPAQPEQISRLREFSRQVEHTLKAAC